MLSLSFKASLLATVMVLIIKATFWRPYWEILTSRYFEAKDGQYSNNCHTPLNNRFQVVLWCLSSRKHFGTSTWNFLLKPITTKNMAKLHKLWHAAKSSFFFGFMVLIVRAILWCSYSVIFAYKIRTKRWPIFKILLHAFESPFSGSRMVLIIRKTF